MFDKWWDKKWHEKPWPSVAIELSFREVAEDAWDTALQSHNNARDEICPHYFEATDGVHVVVVGRCNCKGKLSPVVRNLFV
jgi:hypothetical protein